MAENLISRHIRRQTANRENFGRDEVAGSLSREHLELGELAQKAALVVGARIPGRFPRRWRRFALQMSVGVFRHRETNRRHAKSRIRRLQVFRLRRVVETETI